MYKGLKYNTMIFLLIAVIGIFLGAGMGLSAVSDGTLNPLPGIDVPGDVDGGQNEMPTGQFVAPSNSASAFTRIDFAFKVLKEGDGFSAEISQAVVAMSQVQNIYTKALRAGKVDFNEEWQYTDIPFAKNEFVSRYSNGQVVKTNIISDRSKFSGPARTYEQGFSNATKQEQASDYISRVGNFNDFPITVNKNTASVTRYDKLTDKNNYVITVSVNPSLVDATYFKTFEENGTKDVSFKEITIIFKINKKTGFFTSINKTESFTASYAGFNVTCSGSMNLVFTKMNTSMKAEIDAKVAQNF